jgi:hypothetical protein
MLGILKYTLGGIVAVGYIVAGIGILDFVNTDIATSNLTDWVVWATSTIFTMAGFFILMTMKGVVR